MAYKVCEDCGSRLRSDGVCPNCDEEVIIYESASDYPYSEGFMQAVEDGEERAARR